MPVVRLNHVQITIPPGGEETARQFYCGLLCLQEIPKPESLAQRGGLWLQVGDSQVHVGIEDGVNRSVTKAHVAYEVTDLQALRETLRRVGISVVAQVCIPGYDRFEVRDPFGNKVEFLQALGSKP
jgi:catechol 2,3-dioxygenase-like lactoylglutathione lyase family enzyme